LFSLEKIALFYADLMRDGKDNVAIVARLFSRLERESLL
jgi:hypothetical protein